MRGGKAIVNPGVDGSATVTGKRSFKNSTGLMAAEADKMRRPAPCNVGASLKSLLERSSLTVRLLRTLGSVGIGKLICPLSPASAFALGKGSGIGGGV